MFRTGIAILLRHLTENVWKKERIHLFADGFLCVLVSVNQRLEFLHWCFTAFYIVRNAHIVGYCGGVIAYRLIFFVLSHKMLHQISTKLTPRLAPNLSDKLEFTQLVIFQFLPCPFQSGVAYCPCTSINQHHENRTVSLECIVVLPYLLAQEP